MKCEKVLVRRGRTSILCQERTHLGWSGEDTPRSYVRRGYTSILCQERTVDTPRSYVREDSGHASTLVKRGYTSILCKERTANTLRSWSGEDTPRSYMSGEGTPQPCTAWPWA